MRTTTFIAFTHSAAAVIGGATLAAVAIASFAGYTALLAPFFWLDVAVVYFLAALPLAASLTAITFSPAARSQHLVSLLAVELLVLTLVPNFYVRVRTQHDLVRVGDLIDQSRFGEAQSLAQRTLQLAPHAKWRGNQLSVVAASLDKQMAALHLAVAEAVEPDANDSQRTNRAKLLAMLGRTTEALAVLEPSGSLSNDGEACNLRGTIYETQRLWTLARQWYLQAQDAWSTANDSPDKTAGLARAITGVAFCNRKLGRLRDAEAAWHDLLALAPTADNHFLLAQFYRDTQQTSKAKYHAEQAMKLDANRFRAPANRLLDNLVTSHFGCWGVFQTSETLTR